MEEKIFVCVRRDEEVNGVLPIRRIGQSTSVGIRKHKKLLRIKRLKLKNKESIKILPFKI